ncbi:RNase adapter RapZ [Enemella sp. A6]|uniref:RNase adapter RapZ n=1 Tax=Enemella sp. A6 TaxID=3440152 RepID=UPI003EBAF819
MSTNQLPRVAIVTGMSGAGRSTAANAMEDSGWYVVDNLPAGMVTALCEVVADAGYDKLAVVLDVRSRDLFSQVPVMFTELQAKGIVPEILYLEATDDVIVRRQDSARRPHPLQGDGPLLDGIHRERDMLAALRGAADLMIDTSRLNVHQLRSRVSHAFGAERAEQLRMTVMSFGFKHGVPIDADFVMDVRFLPNPHWVPELRPLTGLDEPVRSYVLGQTSAVPFLDRLQSLVLTVQPGYLHEGKYFGTVAIGCTGGRHRSTAMAEEFGRRLRELGMPTKVMHRDVERS